MMEPTQQAEKWNNPYTDEHGLPILPPPPPMKKNKWKIILICSMVLILISSNLISFAIGLSLSGKGKTADKPVSSASASTVVSTVLASPSVKIFQPSAPYSAHTIVSYFIANVTHTGASTATFNTNWNCCDYMPEGGAYIWCDSCADGPGPALNTGIATFASHIEAITDGNQLAGEGYGVIVVNDCLLSYDAPLNEFAMAYYKPAMLQVCI